MGKSFVLGLTDIYCPKKGEFGFWINLKFDNIRNRELLDYLRFKEKNYAKW